MATISELNYMLNRQDRRRRELEATEKADARAGISLFTTIATKKIATADEIVGLASGESNLETLDSLETDLEGTKTGVDVWDSLIEAKGEKITLRKKAVAAKNQIGKHIKEVNNALGNDVTIGAKNTLESIREEYINTADQYEQNEKILINNKIAKTQNHLNFRLLKNQYDTDSEKEGYQLPSHYETADRQYFEEVIQPMIETGEASGSYVAAIQAMQSGFSDIRRERKDYDTAQSKLRERQAADLEDKKVDLEKKTIKIKENTRSLMVNELKSLQEEYRNGFASLKPQGNRVLPAQNRFFNSLTHIDKIHATSMTGENLVNADLKGMLKAIDNSIILNLNDDHKGIGDKPYLDQYMLKGDALDANHMGNMEQFIFRNTLPQKDGSIKYNINFGDAGGHRGMSALIKTRKKLIEMLNTPGMFMQSIDPKLNMKANQEVGGSFGTQINPNKG